MSEFAVGEEVMFRGARVRIVDKRHPELYVIQQQPGSVSIGNVPGSMLGRASIPPSPEDDPVARIEQSLADINMQLKGIRELLSKRMPKKRIR